jgi:putative peptidoglycan lipid II flippase
MAERSKPRQDGKLFGFSVMSLGSAASAILAYVRFSQITAIFGANWRTDALAVAMVFPQMLKEVVSHSFGSAFIPIYSRVVEKRGTEGGVRFANLVLSWMILTGTILMGVLWFSSGFIVRIISPSGSSQLLGLAEHLLHIVVPIIILSPINGILANYIKYEKRFRILPVAGVINLSVSLTLILAVRDAIDVSVLPVSMLAGGVAEFLFLLYHSTRSGFRPRVSITKDHYMGQLAVMSFPVVFGTVVGFFAPVADKMLASFLQESSLTAIDYATRIKTIVLSVVFGPFLVFADLDFSLDAAKGRLDSLKNSLRTSMNTTSLVMIPTAGLLSILAVPVVSVFFQRGNFTGENARYVGYALTYYAPWLAQFGIGALVSRAFYAQKDSFTPVAIGVLGVISNVLLNVILVGPMGIGGLALATTLTSTAKTIYLIWSLSRKVSGLDLRLIAKEQFKILASSLLGVGAIAGLMMLWPFSTEVQLSLRLFQLVVFTAAGGGVMALSMHITGCRTFRLAGGKLVSRVNAGIRSITGKRPW